MISVKFLEEYMILVQIRIDNTGYNSLGLEEAWNQTANVHLATTILSNQFKFWGITFL